jgi:hypothetical protein
VRPLALQGAIFANHIKRSFRDFTTSLTRIPRLGVAASATYVLSPFEGAELTLRAAMRYTGKSQAELFLGQRATTLINFGARLGLGRYGASLDVTNLGDIRDNRFSLASPYGDDQTIQSTPYRPRSIRLGFDVIF